MSDNIYEEYVEKSMLKSQLESELKTLRKQIESDESFERYESKNGRVVYKTIFGKVENTKELRDLLKKKGHENLIIEDIDAKAVRALAEIDDEIKEAVVMTYSTRIGQRKPFNA